MKINARQILMIIFGSALYSAALNLFLTPLHLYAGGIPGLSQMLRTLFFSSVTHLDMAGILNFCFNVPLFILAYKTMKPSMVVCTAVSIAVQTILISFLPIPSAPILDDKLACIMIAGVMGGFGCGLMLSYGGSGGGLDLLGLYLSQHTRISSVGTVGIIFNCFLYTAMAILFDLQTAIYSLLFIIVFSLVMDRNHQQNIEIQLTVFTHHKEVENMLMKDFGRGVTAWKGEGAYTGNEMDIFVCVIAKKEKNEVIRRIREMDSQAFIIENGNVLVTGGFQKRLV